MNHQQPQQTVGLFLSGPAVLLLLLACLALFALLLLSLHRLDRLATLGARAGDRLERGGPLPTLWGLAAGVLVFAASGVLFGTKILALLGVVVLLSGVVLLGLGLTVAALRVGRALVEALDGVPGEDARALGLGLPVLFLASVVPFLGWFGVGLTVASGVGAVLEALFSRQGGA